MTESNYKIIKNVFEVDAIKLKKDEYELYKCPMCQDGCPACNYQGVLKGGDYGI